MAEIIKVTTPMIPQENLGKNRPVTEQAVELNNPNRVNKRDDDKGITEREAGGALKDAMGRAAMETILRESGDLSKALFKMVALLQMGLSTSDIVSEDPMRSLLQEIFVTPEQLYELLLEQEESATLFGSEAFEVMRDVLDKFEDVLPVRDALSDLLKVFEHNVNLQNSLKSILYNSRGILDYMFSKDREQFSQYLDGLGAMLLPELVEPPLVDEQGNPLTPEQLAQLEQQAPPEPADPKEAAALLKNNLMPLLGEIVVKYYQNASIRDIVMVIVHNVVRVDRGTPEALDEAIRNLVAELAKVANLPERFEENLREAVLRGAESAKQTPNRVMDTLAEVISETLRSDEASPAALRQAENLMMSLLQNQSSLMNILHFALPMQTPDGLAYAELYVDPESEENKGKAGEPARKLFLSVESERHGTMELCFWQTGDRVDFMMWCGQSLVEPMRMIKRSLSDIMGAHGFRMGAYRVEELHRPHTVVEVFPKLLERKVGIDVRI